MARKPLPFPRDAVQEALVLDARDRAAAKKRALVEDVPPPPVFDPFEDNLVRASVLRRGDGVSLSSTQDAPPAPPPPAPLDCRDRRSKPSARRPGPV